jgi:hypothetical protein
MRAHPRGRETLGGCRLSARSVPLEAPEAIHPRKHTLHRPSVSAQFLAGFDAPTSDARSYAPLPQGLATSREVVALVSAWSLLGCFLGRPRRGLRIGEMARPQSFLAKTFESWTLAAEWVTESGMPSRSTTMCSAWSPVCPYLCRIRTGLLAPPGAGTLAESKDALSQLIWSASPKRSKSLLCSRSHTCHSLSLRQHVMPESRIPSLEATSPKECRSSRRIGCR